MPSGAVELESQPPSVQRPHLLNLNPAAHCPVEHEHIAATLLPELPVLVLPQPEARGAPRGHRGLHIPRSTARTAGVVPVVAFELESVALRGSSLRQRAVPSRVLRAIHRASPRVLTHDPRLSRVENEFRRKTGPKAPARPAGCRTRHPLLDRYGRRGVSGWTDRNDGGAVIHFLPSRRPSGPAQARGAVHPPTLSLESEPSLCRSPLSPASQQSPGSSCRRHRPTAGTP